MTKMLIFQKITFVTVNFSATYLTPGQVFLSTKYPSLPLPQTPPLTQREGEKVADAMTAHPAVSCQEALLLALSCWSAYQDQVGCGVAIKTAQPAELQPLPQQAARVHALAHAVTVQ